MEYFPFGETFIEERTDAEYTSYLYNGKELDEETGLYYYGARYYDARISIWYGVDPLAEKYAGISSFAYVANNPVKFIDPDGMRIDDYFNENGKYPGKDNAKTDNIKIIAQKDWDTYKNVNSDGSESINHATGNSNSTDHSQANLSDQASLEIYDHYNPTNLKLERDSRDDGKTGGLAFSHGTKSGVKVTKMKVRIDGNNFTRIADHANEIVNIFSHEEKHYDDYKSLGSNSNAYEALGKNVTEPRAVSTQMNHPSFNKTREIYQKAIINYGKKFGMLFPIESLPAKVK